MKNHWLNSKNNLNNSNAKLRSQNQIWQIRDNYDPISLTRYDHELTQSEKVMPILDEEYIEKGYAWHMYLAQLETKERKMKWEKVSTNL